MPKLKDLTGLRFGRLTAIRRNGTNNHKKPLWLCECDCGNFKDVISSHLINRSTSSCGCLNNELRRDRNHKNLIGERFGKLVVIQDLGLKDGKREWLCRCDCGGTKRTITSYLTSGDTKSCGCLLKQSLRERNFIDLTGNKYGKLTAEKFIRFDKDNYSIWRFICDCGGVKEVKNTNVVSGYTSSCGCTRNRTQVAMFDWIKQNTQYDVLSDDKSILGGKDLDIYIPDKSFAIEYDGLYWHSDLYKDKYFHLNKTKLCEKKNIQLFHVFENEWLDPIKQEIWKSMIRYKLGRVDNRVYARNCIIREINNTDKSEFFKTNHLQGDCSSSVNIGLYYNDELVSIMSFGKSRYNKNYVWELLRFCNRINNNVIGGASKLLNYFRNHYEGSIISYANRRWSNGSLYEKLGFRFLQETKPNYFYFDRRLNVFSRLKFQKHKLKDLLDVFDVDLSERDNMKLNNYNRIYDCGNLVFVLG